MPNNTQNIALRSEEVQDILTAIPTWLIRWGNTIVLLLILLLLGISWMIKYPDIIAASAIITTEKPPQKEYALNTGKIDTFLIKDQAQVSINTPLVILENTANFQDVFLLKSIVDKIQLRKTQFEFPIKELPVLFLGEIETDFALFANNYDLYELNRQLRPFSGEAQAQGVSLTELQNRLQNLEAQQELGLIEMQFKKRELKRQQQLLEAGLISAQAFEQEQLEQIQAERNYKDRQLSISQTKEAISNAQWSSRNLQINQTKEEKQLLRNVIQSFNQLKKAIRDWELRYVLTAKIAGKVCLLDLWTENQLVNAGDLILTIIPEHNKEYLAKLKTPSLNSGKIQIGQNVNIQLANFPATEFGSLPGLIEKISLIADQEGQYLIDVALSEQLITNYNQEIEFRQEMQGQAEIITEDLRLIERFFYQLKQVLAP